MSYGAIDIPVLETERLVLRGFTPADHAPLCAFYADARTARFVGGLEEPRVVWRRMASYIGHWALRGYGMWALADKQTDAFVGYVGNWFPDGWPEPEIAYGLVASAHGRGLAVEAASRALRHAYENLGWMTAISAIDVDNRASQGVARKLGATREKTGVAMSGFTADIWRHLPPDRFLDGQHAA